MRETRVMRTYRKFVRAIAMLAVALVFAAAVLGAGALCAAQENASQDKPLSEGEARLLRQIEEAVAAGNTDEAQVFMARALLFFEDPALKSRVYAARGHLNMQLGLTDDAISDLDQAVRLAPDDPAALQARGIVFYQLKRPGLAIPDLDRAMELGPTDPGACTARGNLHLDFGNLMGALKAYDLALELDPEYTEAIFQRGYVYSRLGHFNLAVEAFTRVADEFPDKAFPFNNRGIALSQAGREAESLADFQKAVDTDSNYASAWSNLGYTRFLMGDAKGALDAYEKADDLERDNAYCLCNQAEANFRLGEKIKTKGALKKCLKAASQDAFFQREEAYYIATLEMLKEYVDKNNELPNEDILLEKAAGAWDEDRRKQAFSFYTMAYMLNPNRAETLFRLGALSDRLGRRSYALNFLNRFLARNPDHELAGSARELLESLVIPLPPAPGMGAASAPAENAKR